MVLAIFHLRRLSLFLSHRASVQAPPSLLMAAERRESEFVCLRAQRTEKEREKETSNESKSKSE